MGKIHMTLPLLGLTVELSKSKYILSAVVSNRLFWGVVIIILCTCFEF